MTIRSSPRVDIVLATYNGARFLADQLASIERQSEADWRLIVRDDGSSDGTREILRSFRDRIGADKVAIVEEPAGNLGAPATFSLLALRSSAPYVMFCDQDDVWLPEKVAVTLAAMVDAERQFGGDTPLLVHTDLRVVDESLNTIGDSFWRFQHLDPRRDRLNRLLVSNVVTGCAAMINRPLVEAALPVPPEAMMHDWWIALVASLDGQIVFVEQPTILYRQHAGNSIGAQRWGLRFVLGRLKRLRDRNRTRTMMERLFSQAAALQRRLPANCPESSRRVLDRFCALQNQSPLHRKLSALRNRFFTHGIIRNIGLLLTI